jgi:4-amino-4-deoxy-L-arabinose transferase-like glycosyltransferase
MSLTSRPARPLLWRAVLLVGGLAVILGLNLATLLETPPPFVDEGIYGGYAWDWIHTGHPFGMPATDAFQRHDYYPWTAMVFYTLGMIVAGPHLVALRIVSLLFGLLLLGIIYNIGARLIGPRGGLVAAGILAFTPSFVYSSHLARVDIMATTCGFGAIALYLSDPAARRVPRAALAGLLIGGALAMHPNAVIYAPVIFALYLLDYGRRVLRRPGLWGFAGGLGAGVILFLASQILPWADPAAVLARLGTGAGRTPPMLRLDPAVWLESLTGTGVLLVVGLTFWLLLLVAAVVVLGWARTAAARRLLVILGGLLLQSVLVFSIHPIHYAILVVPAAALVIAAFLDGWVARPWRPGLATYVRLALTGGLIAAAGISAWTVIPRQDPAAYESALAAIRAAVAPGGAVLGTTAYWFAVPDHPYYNWEQPGYYRLNHPGATFLDSLTAMHPDVVVMDGVLAPSIVDDVQALSSDIRFLYIPRAELTNFLATQGQLAAARPIGALGTVRIYKIPWP